MKGSPYIKFDIGNIKVHEHRAPTDQSVQLLRELELAAEKRVTNRGKLKLNTLEVRWQVHYSGEDDEYTCRCRFNLNGDEHYVDFKVCKYDLDKKEDLRDFAILIKLKLVEKLSEFFTIELLKSNQLTPPLFLNQ